jgi:hypothetical protein
VRAASSSALLPIPAGPSISTHRPSPLRAAASSSRMTPSSRSRSRRAVTAARYRDLGAGSVATHTALGRLVHLHAGPRDPSRHSRERAGPHSRRLPVPLNIRIPQEASVARSTARRSLPTSCRRPLARGSAVAPATKRSPVSRRLVERVAPLAPLLVLAAAPVLGGPTTIATAQHVPHAVLPPPVLAPSGAA